MTQEHFLKLYDDLQKWESENLQKPLSLLNELVNTLNMEIFEITPKEMLELFPNRLEAIKYYKNIHCLSLEETVKLFPATLVKISFECGYTPPLDGYCEVWIWTDGSGLNENYVSTTPIYNILNSKEVYDLYCGEIIEVESSILTRHFKKI
jgi:hypothetical protein